MEIAKDLTMLITINDPSLVLLIGPSGSGKSTFARKHFRATEILSSDYCRALVSDDESNQTATDDAFEILHLLLAKRLKRQLTTVIDATNVEAFGRHALVSTARTFSIAIVAIVFALPEAICQMRNQLRAGRKVDRDVIASQITATSELRHTLDCEGYSGVFTFNTVEQVDTAQLLRN